MEVWMPLDRIARRRYEDDEAGAELVAERLSHGLGERLGAGLGQLVEQPRRLRNSGRSRRGMVR
jgi:hypothetical protein